MKKNHVQVILLITTFLFVSKQNCISQTCNCNSTSILASGSTFTSDFNCYMYVKAYFKDNPWRTGVWIPSSDYFNTNYPGGMGKPTGSSIAEDSDFYEVTNSSTADAYLCGDHAGIILSGGCLIEKTGYGTDLILTGQTTGTCGSSGIRFFKYAGASRASQGTMLNCSTGSSCVPNATTCSITGYYGNYNNLATFNTIYSSSTYVVLNTQGAINHVWRKVSGSGYFTSASYIYLSANQYITIEFTAYNSCDNAICSRTVTFSRSGGYSRSNENNNNSINLPAKSSHQFLSFGLEEYPNPTDGILNIDINSDEIKTVAIVNTLGQPIHTLDNINGITKETVDLSRYPKGIYYLIGYSKDKISIAQKKFVLSK